MTVFLPDTNVLVDSLNGKRNRRELLRELLLQGHRLACCAITWTEVYAGMRPHEAPRTDQFLSSLVWYETSRGISRRAGRLRFDWARQGVTLSLADGKFVRQVKARDLYARMMKSLAETGNGWMTFKMPAIGNRIGRCFLAVSCIRRISARKLSK